MPELEDDDTGIEVLNEAAEIDEFDLIGSKLGLEFN
jgi:hypothetical protein